MGYGTDGLTFNTLRSANKARLPLFKNKHGQRAHTSPDGSDWSPAQWLQATIGELGEYANIRKKFERGDITLMQFKALAAKELADVQTYLDILALRCCDHYTTMEEDLVSNRDGCQKCDESWDGPMPQCPVCGELTTKVTTKLSIPRLVVDPEGVDLGQATMDKWNEVSDRVGVNIHVEADDWHYTKGPIDHG